MKKRQMNIYSNVVFIPVAKTEAHTKILFDLYRKRDEVVK